MLRKAVEVGSFYESFSDLTFCTLIVFVVTVLGLALRLRLTEQSVARTTTEATKRVSLLQTDLERQALLYKEASTARRSLATKLTAARDALASAIASRNEAMGNAKRGRAIRPLPESDLRPLRLLLSFAGMADPGMAMGPFDGTPGYYGYQSLGPNVTVATHSKGHGSVTTRSVVPYIWGRTREGWSSWRESDLLRRRDKWTLLQMTSRITSADLSGFMGMLEYDRPVSGVACKFTCRYYLALTAGKDHNTRKEHRACELCFPRPAIQSATIPGVADTIHIGHASFSLGSSCSSYYSSYVESLKQPHFVWVRSETGAEPDHKVLGVGWIQIAEAVPDKKLNLGPAAPLSLRGELSGRTHVVRGPHSVSLTALRAILLSNSGRTIRLPAPIAAALRDG